MSDNIDLSVKADGADGVERIVTAIDRLHTALSSLGNNNSGLARLEQQVKTMQASMTTGFAEIAALAKKGETEVVASAERTAKNVLSIEQRRDIEMNKLRQQDLASRVAWWNKVLNMQERRDTELNAASAKAAAKYVAWWEKAAAERNTIQQRRDTELNAAAAKAAAEYTAWWQKAAAERVAIERKRDVELHAMRAREHADYTAWWSKTLNTQEAAQRKQLEMARNQQVALATLRATAAEKQRALNTSFITSPLSGQIATAEKAKVYSQLGGNAAEKYGSVAATADLAALRRQHELLPAATRNSRAGVASHNEAMREAHSLARGLTGSLGGLWLTYGSLVPLVAGAAIASSLKNIVSAGREVEYQLKFVEALGGGKVNLDSFLAVTDSTVVSVKEAAEGMRALAQNGLNAQQSLSALPAVLNLAVIGEMGVSQAALSATGALSAFGMKLQDIDKVGDIFAQAAATSNTSVSAMAESMKQASTVASIYGASLEETAAALGTLAKINITGSAAGTAYTNMLTNLYAPTQQAAKALKELGVSTDDGMGGMKNSTQLLEELRLKLSQFNEPARADFLGDIFTVRGQKAASTIIENLDLYKKKIEEAQNATGFMGSAVAKLEDSTTGAFKRLSNSVSDSLNRAFESSGPALQELTMHLATVARSDGVVKLLTSMADGVIRVTRTIVEWSGTLAVAGVALVALRAVGGITTMLGAYSTASAVAATATTTLAAKMTLLNASLGWIGLAIGVAVVAWQLFIATTSDVEKADTRIRNSIETNIEYLQRETKALEERNKAWNPETQRFDKKVEPDTADATEAITKRIGLRDQEIARIRAATATGLQNDNLAAGSTLRLARLEDAQAADKRLLWKQTALAESLATAQSEENYKKDRANALDQIDLMVKKGQVAKTIAGESVPLDPLGNEKSRAIAREAAAIGEKLKNNTIDAAQAKIELMAVEQKYNASLSGRDKPDNKGANATLSAHLKELQHELDLQRQIAQHETMVAKQQYARGEIGDLQLINAELATKAALREKEISVAERQWQLADKADKPVKRQEYLNRKDTAEKQGAIDTLEAEERRQTVLAKMAQETVAAEAKSLADKGQYVQSYLLSFESQYGTTIDRVYADIAKEDDASRRAQLVRYLEMLEKMRVAGTEAALGKQLGEQFKAGLKGLEQQLGRFANDAEGGSMSQVFLSALAAEQQLEAALPSLIAKQKEMQDLANRTGVPEDQTAASKALEEIDEAAIRTRKVWMDVGKVIGKSLGDAFGTAGRSVGQLITVTAAYGAKQKEIQLNLKRDIATNPGERAKLEARAAEEMAASSVKAYGDMAGAAKGFFKEKTGAYRALETAEKAFRAYELAMELKTMVVKSGYLTAFTGLFVASKAKETAATVASVAPDVAASQVKGQAAAVAGVAGQAQGDPYTAWGRMAAMAAVMAGLGFAIAGMSGKKDNTAKDRQAANGTGSILGDTEAKSESISKALEMVQDNTYQGLAVSYAMLNSLRAIEAGLAGVGSILAQNGVTGDAPGKTYGSIANFGNSTRGQLLLGGPVIAVVDKLLGGFLGKMTGKVLGAVFGGKTEALDIGLTASKTSVASALAGGMQPVGYADMKKEGGWFRSDKKWTDQKSLGDEASQQFTMIIQGMADTIIQAGGMLGVSGDAFEQRLNAFVIDIGKISTKDLKPEEIQAQLEAAFSKVGDDMARWALGDLTKFQKVGEGALETLARVAQGYQAIDVVFASFGKTFGQLGLESLNARERLIELSGGLEEFLSQGSYFLENFYTEQEQAAAMQRRVQPTLSKYGLKADGPDAMQQFRAYIEALDTTTAAGAEAYAALMLVAPGLKAVADAAEDVVSERRDLQGEIDELMMTSAQLRAKERNELDASNRALYDQLQAAKAVAEARDRISEAYENEKSAIEETIDRLSSLAKNWKEFRDDLVLGENSTLTPQQKYMAAEAKYQETLAKARSGDTDAQDAYQSVAQAFLDASRTVYASGSNYTRDFDGVLQATSDNEVWARQQVDSAKASLDVLKSQVDHLISIDEKIGTVAQELSNFARMQAEYLQRQAAASAVPGAATMPPGSYYPGAPTQATNLEELLREQMEGQKAFYDQQAQETADIINSNAEATRQAAEAAAQATRDAANSREWQNRYEAQTK